MKGLGLEVGDVAPGRRIVTKPEDAERLLVRALDAAVPADVDHAAGDRIEDPTNELVAFV